VFSEETCQVIAETYFAWKRDNQLESGYFSISIDKEVENKEFPHFAISVTFKPDLND
jgi:hypothetical protein